MPGRYTILFFKSTKNDKGELQVELSTEVEGLDIYYSFDNSQPDDFYPKYTSPLQIPKEAIMLKGSYLP